MKTAVLTIAGFDNSLIAGITEDIRVIKTLSVDCVGIVACLTAQNPKEVKSILPVTPTFLKEQLEAVFEYYEIPFAKIGMVYEKEIIEQIVKFFKGKKTELIIDPLITSSSGSLLLKENALDVLKSKLLPGSFLITPNIKEAEILSGIKIKTASEMEEAAKILKEKYKIKNVLVTGGHLKTEKVINVLVTKKEVFRFELTRIKGGENIHGTGCCLSSAITGFCFKGDDLKTATVKAFDVVSEKIKSL